MTARPLRIRLVVAGLSLLAVASGVLSACGGDDAAGGAPQPRTAAGKRGMAVAKDNGCVACHTASGSRSTGPTWKGLAGSEVQLSGGEAVTADDRYLTESITAPKAKVVDGFPNIMPENGLTEAQVADVLAYLHELGE